MENVVVINATKLQTKEIMNKRVVTFKDIDLVHKRPEGTARRNFNSNVQHFLKNEDYFIVTPDNASMYEISTLGKIPPKGITLLTESGYLMVVKSFTDNLSWKVQRQLVNSYFKLKEVAHIICDKLEEKLSFGYCGCCV